MAHFKAVVVVALAALVLILGGRFADLSGTKATAANGAKPIALQRPLDGGPVLFYPTGPDGMYTPGLFQDRYLADGTRAAAIVDHDAVLSARRLSGSTTPTPPPARTSSMPLSSNGR